MSSSAQANDPNAWRVTTGVQNQFDFYGRHISRVIVDPRPRAVNGPWRVWAAAYFDGNLAADGIYRSETGGTTSALRPGVPAWRQITGRGPGQIDEGLTVTDMEYNQTAANDLVLYAGVKGRGIFRSTNDGTTWGNPIALPDPTNPTSSVDSERIGRISFAADHTVGSRLVYAAVAETDGNLIGVYRFSATPMAPSNCSQERTGAAPGARSWLVQGKPR